MTCKYANEYYLRLLCVPLCTAAPPKLRHIIIVISGFIPSSTAEAAVTEAEISISILAQNTQSCFVCLFFEPAIFMASFPVHHLGIRMICLFTLNPSSCIFGAWFKIGILVVSYMHKFLFMFCAIFLSATAVHTIHVVKFDADFFPLSLFPSCKSNVCW